MHLRLKSTKHFTWKQLGCVEFVSVDGEYSSDDELLLLLSRVVPPLVVVYGIPIPHRIELLRPKFIIVN